MIFFYWISRRNRFRLKKLVAFPSLEINKDLVAAAKTASRELKETIVQKDYKALLQQLTEVEKADYLLQVLKGELRVDMKLKKHVDRLATSVSISSSTISLVDLKKQQTKEQQNREKAEQLAAEQKQLKKMQKLGQVYPLD